MIEMDESQQLPTNFHSPILLRIAYQQKITNYLSHWNSYLSQKSENHSSAVSWIGETARSLALRSVANEAQVKHGDSKIYGEMNGKRVFIPNWADFICLACGTLSFPTSDALVKFSSSTESATSPISILPSDIPSKTTIRTMKRGRTRRRRASRCVAKQRQKESLSQQRIGGSNIVNGLQREDTIQDRNSCIANCYRLGDGRSRQCVVTKCNFCGHKRKRKGVDVSKKKRVKAFHSGERLDHVKKLNLEKSNNFVGDKYRKKNSSGIDESNFIPLISSDDQAKQRGTLNVKYSNTKKSISLDSQHSTQTKPLELKNPTFSFRKKPSESSLLLRGSKMNKKQGPSSKGISSLMSFLSSLDE